MPDGQAGLFVPLREPEAPAETLLRLKAEPEAAQAMGVRGWALVEARFSWSRIAALTRQVYEDVVT
jgi:glycosyltransferase involved in cell wall biosynthesis